MDQAKDPSAKATGYGAVARAQLLSRELLKAVEVGGLEETVSYQWKNQRSLGDESLEFPIPRYS